VKVKTKRASNLIIIEQSNKITLSVYSALDFNFYQMQDGTGGSAAGAHC
jgi:hypothetical protein